MLHACGHAAHMFKIHAFPYSNPWHRAMYVSNIVHPQDRPGTDSCASHIIGLEIFGQEIPEFQVTAVSSRRGGIWVYPLISMDSLPSGEGHGLRRARVGLEAEIYFVILSEKAEGMVPSKINLVNE